MKKILISATAAMLACALASSVAVAQQLTEVTVQATRTVTTKIVGTTSSGIPILGVELGYTVSTAGINFVSPASVSELEKRINDAALAACKELGRQYPDSKPGDAECAKAAADKAMVKVHQIIQAPAKAPAK